MTIYWFITLYNTQKGTFTNINTIFEAYLPISMDTTLPTQIYIFDYQGITPNKTLTNIFSYTFIIVNLH